MTEDQDREAKEQRTVTFGRILEPEPEPWVRYEQIEAILRKNTQLAEVQVNAMMTLITALDNCD